MQRRKRTEILSHRCEKEMGKKDSNHNSYSSEAATKLTTPQSPPSQGRDKGR